MNLQPKDFIKEIRFKLIKDYPLCPFREGDIIYANEFEGKIYISIKSGDINIYPLNFKSNFRILSWWENRTIEQLLSIKYMKVIYGSDYYGVGDIVEVIDFMYNNPTIVGGRNSLLFNLKGHFFLASQLEPSTKEDHDKLWNKSL